MGEIAMQANDAAFRRDSEEITDLVTRACHDPDAFTTLYQLHYPRVYSYVMRTLMNVPATEDVVSETFLKVLKGLNHYKQREARFESWLYRIATNAMMDHFRRKRREPVPAGDLGWTKEPTNVKMTPGADLEQVERYEALHGAIRKLKDIYRVTLVLHYFEEEPLKEVARITECTLATAKWRLYRARKQLGRILDKEALSYEQ
jgi:RNA polymerase sigma-70 factor, ECF subfamily